MVNLLTETAVSTILTASVTGAGLLLAIYALITPISRRIFNKRLELRRKRTEEFNIEKEKISSESSDEDFIRLRKLASSIKTIKTFPKYLGPVVLLVFSCYFMTIMVSLFWFIVPSHTKSFYEPSIVIFFFLSIIAFFIVGTYAILDVYWTMNEEHKQIEKEQEKIEKVSKELEQLKKKMKEAKSKTEIVVKL